MQNKIDRASFFSRLVTFAGALGLGAAPARADRIACISIDEVKIHSTHIDYSKRSENGLVYGVVHAEFRGVHKVCQFMFEQTNGLGGSIPDDWLNYCKVRVIDSVLAGRSQVFL